MHPSLNIDAVTVARFCELHHIRRLALFGSQLKGTAGAESDVDLLVEFDPAHIPSLFDIAGMEIELSELAGGKKVDLRTPWRPVALFSGRGDAHGAGSICALRMRFEFAT